MSATSNRKEGTKHYVPNINDSNDMKLCLYEGRMYRKCVFVEESVRQRRDRKHDFRRSGRSGRKPRKRDMKDDNARGNEVGMMSRSRTDSDLTIK